MINTFQTELGGGGEEKDLGSLAGARSDTKLLVDVTVYSHSDQAYKILCKVTPAMPTWDGPG